MKRKAEQSSLLTLSEVFNNPGKQQKTVGVIIDATRPFKTSRSFDYVTKLKIIDPTFNGSTNKALKDVKKNYIHVFVYSQKLEDAPSVNQIGEIVYLKRFDVFLFSH